VKCLLPDDVEDKNQKVFYEVCISSQGDIPPFGPPLPYPPIFTHSEEFRGWLLKLLVNGELAAYKSKLFTKQLATTYGTMVSELVDKSKPKHQNIASKAVDKVKKLPQHLKKKPHENN